MSRMKARFGEEVSKTIAQERQPQPVLFVVMAKSQVRPPYVAEGAIRAFFESIRTKGDPGTVDTKWLESYDLGGAQPHAIVGTLKWLGVIDGDKKTVEGIWNKLRTTQRETIGELVRNAYAPIFKAIDVEQAERADIEGAFIHEYEAGDTGRVTRAFMALCALGGIDSPAIRAAAEGAERAPIKKAVVKESPPAKKVAPIKQPSATKGQGRFKDVPPPPPASRPQPATIATVSFNVDIPADWDREQVRQRIADVLEALRAGEEP
jgi:hypothetical protein